MKKLPLYRLAFSYSSGAKLYAYFDEEDIIYRFSRNIHDADQFTLSEIFAVFLSSDLPLDLCPNGIILEPCLPISC